MEHEHDFKEFFGLDAGCASRFWNYARTLNRRDWSYASRRRELENEDEERPTRDKGPLEEVSTAEEQERADAFEAENAHLLARCRRRETADVCALLANEFERAGFEHAASFVRRRGKETARARRAS